MPRGGKHICSQYDYENMTKALEAVRAGMSIRQTSIEFQVPWSTLADRVSIAIGDTPLKPSLERNQLFQVKLKAKWLRRW